MAFRFAGERPAARAYFRAQELIFATPDADLSVFRFLLEQVSHVAVIGNKPRRETTQRLERICSAGLPVTLTPDILRRLQQRREDAMKEGDWVERHHRPGEPIP